MLLAFPSGASAFTLQRAETTPSSAYFDQRGPIETTFRFADPAPADVTVRVARGTEVVRTIELKQLSPATDHTVEWDGLTDSGTAAPDGKYRIEVGPAGGGEAAPARSPSAATATRSSPRTGSAAQWASSERARNGGRWHHGFDVIAGCGAPLVAARGGTVIVERFDGALDGHYVIIRGRKENQTYRYSHLPRESALDVGDRVRTGDPIGVVGKSGNAASVGCHLHFEIKRGKRFADPEPQLRAWDRYS